MKAGSSFKWFFLFVLVGLPLSVYLFLQMFGENRFDIPIYFQDNSTALIELCEPLPSEYAVPEINEHFAASCEPDIEGTIKLYQVATSPCTDCKTMKNNIRSVQKRLEHIGKFNFVLIRSNDVSSQLMDYEQYNNFCEIVSTDSTVVQYARCKLMLDSEVDEKRNQINQHIVLLDPQNRIRGYYYIYDLMDMDRLVTETNILAKNY